MKHGKKYPRKLNDSPMSVVEVTSVSRSNMNKHNWKRAMHERNTRSFYKTQAVFIENWKRQARNSSQQRGHLKRGRPMFSKLRDLCRTFQKVDLGIRAIMIGCRYFFRLFNKRDLSRNLLSVQ